MKKTLYLYLAAFTAWAQIPGPTLVVAPPRIGVGGTATITLKAAIEKVLANDQTLRHRAHRSRRSRSQFNRRKRSLRPASWIHRRPHTRGCTRRLSVRRISRWKAYYGNISGGSLFQRIVSGTGRKLQARLLFFAPKHGQRIHFPESAIQHGDQSQRHSAFVAWFALR